MQEAFGIVVFAVVALGFVAAAVSLLGRDKVYERIGHGGLSLHEDHAPAPIAGRVAASVRDDEIRQMLTARNARRTARGEAAMDVEAELEKLNRPQADPSLRTEIRDHVTARNRRRVARGLEPLDVEAEIERQLSEL